MQPREIAVDKPEFEEFCELWLAMGCSVFSTNSEGRIWPSVRREKKEDRCYVEGRSSLLRQAANLYTGSIRERGGKFRIDADGALSCKSGTYFVRWRKTTELIAYQQSDRGGLPLP